MNPLTIVSYNIHNGAETEALKRNVVDLASRGAAIFCLQEFWKWMQPVDLEAALLGALGPDWAMRHETPPRPRHDHGVCILWNKSVLKALSFEHLALPLLQRPRTWEKLWIRLHGFGSEAFAVQRSALVGTFDWNGRRLRVTDVHLDWQGGIRHRSVQLACVRDWLATHPEADCEVVCGDFNSIGLNKARQPKAFGKILGDGFETACDDRAVTCPPVFSLDHLFVKNLRAGRFTVHELAGSDHFPVSAELSS